MAGPYYLDDTRTGGTGDGLTWANADLTLAGLPALNNAEIIYVISAYSQSDTAALTIPDVNGALGPGAIYISVDATGDPEPPASTDYENMDTGGGEIQTVGNYHITVYNSITCYGIAFNAGRNFTTNQARNELQSYYDCSIRTGTDDIVSLGGDGRKYFENCRFLSENTTSDNSGGISVGGDGATTFRNCTVDDYDYKDQIFSSLAGSGFFLCESVDFSTVGSLSGGVTLYGGTRQDGTLLLHGCKLPTTSFSFGSALNTGYGWIRGVACDSGNGYKERDFLLTLLGVMDTWGGSNTAREVYRTGGFTHPGSTNPICWKVEATSLTSTTKHNPFVLPEMLINNTTTGATVDVTVEILLGDASTVDALDNDQVWMSVTYYDAASTTLTTTEWTKPATVLTPPTALSSSTAWGTTTDAETAVSAYKLEHTTGSNVAQEGPIVAQVHIGDLGTNDAIYVEPKIALG